MRLQDEPALLTCQRENAITDSDNGIISQTTHYWFANGVHIVAEMEQEWEENTADSPVCPPCDMLYRVVDTAGIDIQPRQKHFKNSCQLHFWMQAHHLP